jgi:hypothetical protein
MMARRVKNVQCDVAGIGVERGEKNRLFSVDVKKLLPAVGRRLCTLTSLVLGSYTCKHCR